MPSLNKVIIAAAGSGKTTRIVKDALSHPDKKSIITTYTINNTEEIRRKIFETKGKIPGNITVLPLFTFLLQDFARPYQNYLYENRIIGVDFQNGISAKYIKENNTKGHYFYHGKDIYTDKISKFAFKCNELSGGLIINSLKRLYDQIYIDEIQDLAGYDLELLEILLKSDIDLTMVGDHRQATFQTNYSQKNKKYAGTNIVNRFKEWEDKGLCSIEHLADSYRCNQSICDFADAIFPQFEKTNSLNITRTNHDGIFTVSSAESENYHRKYKPQILRYNKTTNCKGLPAINYGNSKGLTFNRVLIFPNGPLKNYLKTGKHAHIEKSAAKLYVAITRAKYSVTFVLDNKCPIQGVQKVNLTSPPAASQNQS